jgi:hypothetical protein
VSNRGPSHHPSYPCQASISVLNVCPYSRIRRVKCDEAKPHCQRCTSTGRKCDGYATPKASTTAQPRGMEMVPIGPMRAMSTAGGGFLLTSECVFLSRRSFHMFNELYAPMISGYGTAGFQLCLRLVRFTSPSSISLSPRQTPPADSCLVLTATASHSLPTTDER